MKYRLRLDMIFDSEEDALLLLAVAQSQSKKAKSINIGAVNEETSYYNYELCGHDETKPCIEIESWSLKSEL